MEYLNLDLDKNLTLNSNTTISSQKALKSYIDAKRINLDFLQASAPSEFSIGDKWLNTTDKKVYTATSSSTWDSGVSLTDGQIYSFENLLYHYDGTNILIYSTETITEQNNRNEIKSWFGTQNEYDALSEIDDNTTYYIVDNASVVSTLLATQQEFNTSAQNKAATPYQVNQALGNYLPLAGGNLDANAVLRLTNSNNGTVTLAYNTSNYLAVSSNLSVNGTISTNSLIATSGNIYNGSISGDTVVWSNTLNNYLPLTGGTLTNTSNQLKLANTNYATNFGTFVFDVPGEYLRIYNQKTTSAKPAIFIDYRDNTTLVKGSKLKNYTSNIEGTILDSTDKAVANGLATLDSNTKIPYTQLPVATSSVVGAVKPDGTTTSVDANGVISVIGGGSGGGSVILLQFLQSTTPTTYSTDDKWLNTSDYKLYTATSSSAWDSGTTITQDQIFGFDNLLYHYNGTSLEIYSTESIKEQNVGNETKLWVGTQDEYDSISTYDVNTIYNIVDSETSLANQYHPPLFKFEWDDKLRNNVSWLRADTFSWHSGNVYTAAYQHLINDIIDSHITAYEVVDTNVSSNIRYILSQSPSVGDDMYIVLHNFSSINTKLIIAFSTIQSISGNIITDNFGDTFTITGNSSNNMTKMISDGYCDTVIETNDGHKIVTLYAEEYIQDLYNTMGVAWYYILDIENQRFKLPRENPVREELLQVIRAKGNGITLGLTNGTNNVGVGMGYTPSNYSVLSVQKTQYGTSVGSASDVDQDLGNKTYGITTDSTKSGIISDMTDSTSVYKGKKYLYFYVGNFSQSATEQTAGLNAELFNGKVDLDAANLSDTGKSLIAGIGMPSSVYDDLTLGASGSTYTAPANGFVAFSRYATSASQNVRISCNNFDSLSWSHTSSINIFTWMPVKKGDEFTVTYTAAGTNTSNYFRFIYAEGSKQEAN